MLRSAMRGQRGVELHAVDRERRDGVEASSMSAALAGADVEEGGSARWLAAVWDALQPDVEEVCAGCWARRRNRRLAPEGGRRGAAGDDATARMQAGGFGAVAAGRRGGRRGMASSAWVWRRVLIRASCFYPRMVKSGGA